MDFMYCISMKIVFMYIGLPCRHAIVAIRYNNHKLEDYSDGMLTIGSYNATYENLIRPTKSQQYQETTPFDRLTPPHIKRRPDRPKKCRRKDQNEGQVSNSRLKRSYKEVTCTRCGLNGHNSRGCINGGVLPRPKKWKPTVEEGNNSNATTTTPTRYF